MIAEQEQTKEEIKEEIKNKIKSFLDVGLKLITAAGIVSGIWFGSLQINSFLREQRFSNRMELAGDMVNEYDMLVAEACKAVAYTFADGNNDFEIYAEYSNSPQKHKEKLEMMKKKIMAYGSAKLVNLFFDSYNYVQENFKNGQIDFESNKKYFCSMPLIAAYIKYDLTGEKINPSIFYDSIMDELKNLEVVHGMENFHDDMIITNNELVQKFDLPKEFIWEEKTE